MVQKVSRPARISHRWSPVRSRNPFGVRATAYRASITDAGKPLAARLTLRGPAEACIESVKGCKPGDLSPFWLPAHLARVLVYATGNGTPSEPDPAQ